MVYWFSFLLKLPRILTLSFLSCLSYPPVTCFMLLQHLSYFCSIKYLHPFPLPNPSARFLCLPVSASIAILHRRLHLPLSDEEITGFQILFTLLCTIFLSTLNYQVQKIVRLFKLQSVMEHVKGNVTTDHKLVADKQSEFSCVMDLESVGDKSSGVSPNMDEAFKMLASCNFSIIPPKLDDEAWDNLTVFPKFKYKSFIFMGVSTILFSSFCYISFDFIFKRGSIFSKYLNNGVGMDLHVVAGIKQKVGIGGWNTRTY
ncbi:hypothetical protein LXL04_017863 [Taraxacum kok-saghyz]